MNLIDIAKDTFEYFKDKPAPKTTHYTSEELDEMLKAPVDVESRGLIVTLTEDTVGDTLMDLQKQGDKGRIAVLNFASAKHPGGGWLGGAKAQEEALARSSNLYFGLITQPAFYEKGNTYKNGNCIYSDDILYSEDVMFLKDDEGNTIEPIYCDVITCAAPNLRATKGMDPESEEYLQLLLKRIHKIMAAANAHNVDTLILGAWGCGIFGNDPKRVALAMFSNIFNTSAAELIFAVPYSKENYEAFHQGMVTMQHLLDEIEDK